MANTTTDMYNSGTILDILERFIILASNEAGIVYHQIFQISTQNDHQWLMS